MTYAIGDTVTWTSQAGGHVREKQGEIVAIIEPRTHPPEEILAMGRFQSDRSSTRNHTSYVVKVPRTSKAGKPISAFLYWPRVSLLKKVEESQPLSAA